MHHASFSSPDFQRSYRAEPRPYCVACHAPLASAADGVGCVACHVVAPGHTAATNRTQATTKGCAGCHDFDVPGSSAILQGTEREHRLSAFASTSCEACHMAALGGGRRDHRFDVSRNPRVLGNAIRVQYAHWYDGALVVALVSHGVGHRFPTGDIFRRLTVTVTAYDATGGLTAADTFHLHRDWDGHRGSVSAKRAESLEDDTRLTDAPRELRVRADREPARVHVTVEYERGAGADGELFDAFDTLEILDTDVVLTSN